MSESDDADDLSAAEKALSDHLETLRTEPPTASSTLVDRVVRTARWQRTFRRSVLTVGSFLGAFRDGYRLLFAPRRRS